MHVMTVRELTKQKFNLESLKLLSGYKHYFVTNISQINDGVYYFWKRTY